MGVTMYEWKGAWWITVHHKGQRKRKRVGPGKEGHRAAKAAAEQIRARLALGDTSLLEDAPRVPTFKEAAEKWLEAYLLSGQIRDATHAEYARALRLHGYPRLGSKAVTAITRADVRDVVIDLMSHGKSRSLARNLLAPIRQTFNQLGSSGNRVGS